MNCTLILKTGHINTDTEKKPPLTGFKCSDNKTSNVYSGFQIKILEESDILKCSLHLTAPYFCLSVFIWKGEIFCLEVSQESLENAEVHDEISQMWKLMTGRL